jgi:hypothetical protein
VFLVEPNIMFVVVASNAEATTQTNGLLQKRLVLVNVMANQRIPH